MPQPPVIAYHLIWTAYGSWLPNDPRGSTSTTIASDPIAELGPLHYGRRKIQPSRETVRQFYQRADEVLEFRRILFAPQEFETIAAGLSEGVGENGYTCYAAAIMPDHVHLVIRKHRHAAEEMIARLQTRTRLAVYSQRADLLDAEHPVWTTGGWNGFLRTPKRVHAMIQYVEQNPIKQKLLAPDWPFVKPYGNWPFHKRMQAPNRPGK